MNDSISELITKHEQGSITKEETDILVALLAQNRNYYKDCLLDILANAPIKKINLALDKLKKRIYLDCDNMPKKELQQFEFELVQLFKLIRKYG